jgi:molybdenum cofactor cytidylyltransferase
VLFDAAHFDALLAVEGDTGGRPVLLGSDDSALVEVDDPGIGEDVDTIGDLERQ